ncbi:hypothetical protein AVEN_82916-1 [Araneus ventricosus]|uniref:Uncharacterized protein n=1 Tax=Araneus ventricosus TaxID=182803 RepID=A0A4Y2V650_ARAVE|nr:hypothetical protein AVEN_82916-1 [Araneus ventricosus]
MKFGANDWKWWNSVELKIQNFIRRFQFWTLIRGSCKTKDLPTLGPRVEAVNDTRNSPVLGKRRSVGGKNSATLNLVTKQTLAHP